MNWQTIFNPFSKFSEKTLLLVGILTAILLILACYFTETKMDSLLHFSPAKVGMRVLKMKRVLPIRW